MEDFVSLGFKARKKRDENLELQYFKGWCKENKLVIDNTCKAETLWEKQLSQFKRHELEKKQLCY